MLAYPLPLATIGTLDFVLLIGYLLAMLAIGWHFAREQQSTTQFFLAGRSLGWLPLGMSLMATLISALSYTAIPAQSYEVGLKTLLMPLAVWATVPVLWIVVVPIFRGRGLTSIYEYLELRFDGRTRLLATLLFAAWRLFWLGGVLYAPSIAIAAATGWAVPVWLLVVVMGAVATAYTFWGGIKAVIWTDVVQGGVMLFALLVVIGAAWAMIPGGADQVWTTAAKLGRDSLVDIRWSWQERWSLWGFFPHFFLAMLSFYLADQITAQRFLTAKSVAAAQQSLLLNAGAITILFGGLTYIGLCLLTFYHGRPEGLRPSWVVNLTEKRTYATGEDGRLLLNPLRPEHALSPENLPQLVREQRVLHPNRMEPFETVDDFVDRETGRADPAKLMKRRPTGEAIVHRQAPEEMLTCFIVDFLPPGFAGIVIAALLAGAMSSFDSGLNSITTILILDFHQRFGWGQAWLARRCRKDVAALDDADRLHLAQPMTLAIGIAATVLGLLVGYLGNIFELMVGVINTFGAALLGVFLLGMFTKRCTAPAATAALVSGTLFTLWFMTANKFPVLRSLWPFPQTVSDVWTITFGVAFTLGVGYGLSFFLGRPRTVAELRGLVLGCGPPGVSARDEELPLIAPPVGKSPPGTATRWKK